MTTLVVRHAVRERTAKVHARGPQTWPLCHVTALDGINGLIRRVRITNNRRAVTCRACLRVLTRDAPEPIGARTRDEIVLSYNLSAGDKDNGGVRILRDQMVRACNSGTCWNCCGPIHPGTRIRHETAVLDESTIRTIRLCSPCCDAIIQELSRGDDSFIERAQRCAPEGT